MSSWVLSFLRDPSGGIHKQVLTTNLNYIEFHSKPVKARRLMYNLKAIVWWSSYITTVKFFSALFIIIIQIYLLLQTKS